MGTVTWMPSLTGNDHGYDVSTGYYDSNKGLVLMGTGSREFSIKPPKDTGFLVNGQVEGLLYFDGEEPLIVAGINRRPAVVYKHNN